MRTKYPLSVNKSVFTLFFFIDKGSYLKISVSGAVCALSTLFSDLNSQTLHFGAKMLWTFKKWVTFFFFFWPPQHGFETSDAGEKECIILLLVLRWDQLPIIK